MIKNNVPNYQIDNPSLITYINIFISTSEDIEFIEYIVIKLYKFFIDKFRLIFITL